MKKSAKAEVELIIGKHTMPVPDGMKSVIEDTLDSVGLGGQFKVQLGARIRGSLKAKKVYVCNMDQDTMGILMKIQPAGKDSRHECVMHVPADFRDNPEEFVNLLFKATGDLRYAERVVVVEKTEGDPGDQASSERAVSLTGKEKKKKRPSSASVFKDETMLKLVFDHLAPIFKEGFAVEAAKLIDEIRVLSPGCPEESVLRYLEKKGYLVKKRLSPRKRVFSITEKGTKMIEDLSKEIGFCSSGARSDVVDEIKKTRASYEAHIKFKESLEKIEKEKAELSEKLGRLSAQEAEIREKMKLTAADAKTFENILDAVI